MSTFDTVLLLRAEDSPDMEQDVHVAVDAYGECIKVRTGDVCLPDAYLSPAQARQVAAAMLKAADMCEARRVPDVWAS